MSINIYPLQFDPILKERIWGGEKLKTVLNKSITSKITGESWELSTVEGDVSIIANGDLKGKLLTEVIDEAPNEILGTEVHERFGKEFPLLFKYLDAREDLSVQVHPNDALAKKRHNSFGKTEMWYIMQADEGSEIIVGFKKDSNSKEFLEKLKYNKIAFFIQSLTTQSAFIFSATLIFPLSKSSMVFSTILTKSEFFEISKELDKSL